MKDNLTNFINLKSNYLKKKKKKPVESLSAMLRSLLIVRDEPVKVDEGSIFLCCYEKCSLKGVNMFLKCSLIHHDHNKIYYQIG
jgi:hypothetical protein